MLTIANKDYKQFFSKNIIINLKFLILPRLVK